MKIGFFTDSYFPEIDGVTYTLKLWKERLEERGHEVFIVYPGSGRYSPRENEIPVKSIPNPFYSGYNIPIPLSYKGLPELDVVHCHGPGPSGRFGRRYAEKENIPKIYTHHTPLEEYFEQNVYSKTIANVLTGIYVPIENRFLSRFDKVTSSTGGMDRKVDSKKLPVGVDMEFFRPSKESFLDEKELERPLAGYSGRISNEKNVEEICRFAESFSGDVLIVGEGPKRGKVEEMAPENVEVMDFLEREKLPEFYTGIDVFITASTGDTLGLSTLEANACRTPVVAPDTHPFNATIESENGERFEFGDLENMHVKVSKALENSYDSRGAVKKYSVEKTIDRLEEIYGSEAKRYGE